MHARRRGVSIAAYAIAFVALIFALFPLYWLFYISTKPPRTAFAVHGEAQQVEAMAGLLREAKVPDVRIPDLGQTVEL